MLLRTVVLASVLLVASLGRGEPPALVFTPDGSGLFTFDTGSLRGRLKADGKYQGIYPLVDAASGEDLTHPPGVFSFYRVFKTATRYGHTVRDWPADTKRLDDGAVRVRWPAADEHPIDIEGVYRLAGPGTFDLAITVRPRVAMPGFELFVSSYFTKNFLASVYLKEGADGKGAGFVPVGRNPGDGSGYVMFPRDDRAVAMIRDGRWKIPPNAVDWAIGGRLAAPLVLRRDAAAGITAVMMCPPGDCFAVGSPWNPATPDARGYRSLYLSLFGRDLEAGQVARARCRVVIGRDITDERAVQLYEAFVKAAQSGTADETK